MLWTGELIFLNGGYSICGLQLSNKEEWTVDTFNNMGESQNDHAEWKKPYRKRVHAVWFQFYEILENAN